jgi:N-acetylneuraminate synthase
MQAGDVLTEQNLRAVRPGYGLPPKFMDSLLGKRVARPLAAGTAVDWSIFLAEEG